MTRRTIWLGLLLAASQLATGCCCWRQHCAGWRIQALRSHCHGGQCGAAYGGPVVGPVAGPGCPSCYTPPIEMGTHPPAVAYGGPAIVPGGPPPAGGPPIAGPYPLLQVPPPETHRDPGAGFPQPMPPK
jgi:hypothetical protein